MDSYTAKEMYKLKVPDSSFIFCLDTIKADSEMIKFSQKYCKKGRGLDAYLYLSSYKMYLPIFIFYNCDLNVITCGITRNRLDFIVNAKRNWLVNNELVQDLNQYKMDSIIANYYTDMKRRNKNKHAIIKLNLQAIKNNEERDSLYVSLLKGYYSFIKTEKNERSLDIKALRKEFPFNLFFGKNYVVLPPPPPRIIID